MRRVLDLEADLDEARAEIARLSDELVAARRELETARRARPQGGELVPVAKTVVRVRRS